MAKDQTARTPDADVKRDFETGTVNPGPGMAPPHWADDVPAGSMTGAEQQPGGEEATGKQRAKPESGKAGGSGGCCGG